MTRRSFGFAFAFAVTALGGAHQLSMVRDPKPQADSAEYKQPVLLPAAEVEEDDDRSQEKSRDWSEDEAAEHLETLNRRALVADKQRDVTFAGELLRGAWVSVGPQNQPGCWGLTELDPSDDSIYGVTCGHYGGEQFVHGGSLAGDNFKLISGQFPNRYHALYALQGAAGRRLVAGVAAGGVAYMDESNGIWKIATGLPASTQSTTVHFADGQTVYTTDGRRVYASNDRGSTFSMLQDFGTAVPSHLYAPRFAQQQSLDRVYLARGGAVFRLNVAKTKFDAAGVAPIPAAAKFTTLRLGGDKRRLYMFNEHIFYTSEDDGATWRPRTSRLSGVDAGSGEPLSVGASIAVHPTNPGVVMGGSIDTMISSDGGDTFTLRPWWGQHQIAQFPTRDERHRARIHADNSSTQFFYDSKGVLLTLHSTDGGIYMSRRDWDPAIPLNSDYPKDLYYNLTLFGSPTQETYANSMILGRRSSYDMVLGAQDQGTQKSTGNVTGLLPFVQAPYGDGPSLISSDGETGWLYADGCQKLVEPFALYDANGNFVGADKRKASTDAGVIDPGPGCTGAFIDIAAPKTRIWFKGEKLVKAEWDGTTFTKQSTTLAAGSGAIAAMGQSIKKPDTLYVFQGGLVFRSNDRGTVWDNGTSAGFVGKPTRCSMWISPLDERSLLLACRSSGARKAVFSRDGGLTFRDVSTNFPNADVFGMAGRPEGDFVFASTTSGPFVFDVALQKWASLASGKGPVFSGRGVAWIPSINTVRFATWGSGIWDYRVDGCEAPRLAPASGVTSDTNASTLCPPACEAGETWNRQWHPSTAGSSVCECCPLPTAPPLPGDIADAGSLPTSPISSGDPPNPDNPPVGVGTAVDTPPYGSSSKSKRERELIGEGCQMSQTGARPGSTVFAVSLAVLGIFALRLRTKKPSRA
jgi:hypothetical protein